MLGNRRGRAEFKHSFRQNVGDVQGRVQDLQHLAGDQGEKKDIAADKKK